MPQRVLLTGIAGFIGSHVVEHFLEKTDWDIVGLASFRHMGDPLRAEAFDPSRVKIFTHDLTAPIEARLMDLIGHVDFIINAAAESHVDRSISEPRHFLENNISVAVTMLEYARQVSPKAFLQVSTDEIYGAAPGDYAHKEWESTLPSNPYSASKACQEAAAIAYWRTFGVPVVITNTMNNFGERQDAEKMVPMTIARVFAGRSVPIHGQPGMIGSRFYLHARNHADAMLFLLRETAPTPYTLGGADRPDRYNVVGDRELNNLELAQMIARYVDQPLRYNFVDFHSTRPGHDLRYALDGQKLASLGWIPPVALEESLERTVRWTLDHQEWMR